MMMRRIFLAAFLFVTISGAAQHIVRLKGDQLPIVCHGENSNVHTHQQPPEFFKQLRNSSARVTSSNIEVTYFGFTSQARNAFDYAVSIWESLLTSPVNIRVAAVWTALPQGTLGAAGPSFWVSNFKGAPKYNVYYPGPLAEKLAGTELNGSSEFDIVAQFNSSTNWYYSTTGTPGDNQYDLITVVLHELGHGLGFTSTYAVANGNGFYGEFTQGIPFAFDLAIENGSAQNLYETFASPSTQLATQLTSQNIFFNSVAGGSPIELYAPSNYNDGSSISHLDAITFQQGDPNSLMRPFINSREVNHDPGVATQNIFRDIGWVTTYINHDHLKDRENVSNPIEVKAVITADGTPDYSFDAEKVFLSYATQPGIKALDVQMFPTGNPNEFSATIPAPGAPTTFYYSIRTKDSFDRNFVTPGDLYSPKAALGEKGPQKTTYSFHVGPDVTAPVITHAPKAFISYLDDELVLEFDVKEGNGLTDVSIEYIFNNGPPQQLAPTLLGTDQDLFDGTTIYHYRFEIDLSSNQLEDGDEIQYRIVAEDNSSNQNEAASPETNFHIISVEGLAPARTYYMNDFNTPTDDFIGENFSVAQPSGFTNAAIHSVHPYPEAGDGNEIILSYQLRVPIVVQSVEATMSFDEIVLVEPGEEGVPFPNQDFYDYVVVEGSLDGGKTWTPMISGYDSRDHAPWLTRYNSTNSNGDASLFRKRTIDLLNTFAVGDEIVIRFKLYSDPFSQGWGWCIDNLRIQTDNVPPEILHNHLDYITKTTPELALPVTALDELKLKTLTLEYKLNDGAIQMEETELNGTNALVDYAIDVGSLSNGDILQYRFIAADSAGNISQLPTSGFFECPFVSFEEVVTQYTNDFNSPSSDFIGNFFSITLTSGFVNNAIHTTHPYPSGFGANRKSDFTYMLKKKILLGKSPSYIQYDEVCLMEDHPAGVTFGTENFNDYVIVEASKDDGVTWLPFLDGYDSKDKDVWSAAYSSGQLGSASLFRTRKLNMLSNGNFEEGDELIIRFRYYSNETIVSWGWVIDNLHIQDAVTSVEELKLVTDVVIYPNPVNENTINIQFETRSTQEIKIELLNAQGIALSTSSIPTTSGKKVLHQQDVSNYPNGMYLIRLVNPQGESITKRFIVSR